MHERKFTRDARGLLCYEGGRARIQQAFPWTFPDSHFSVKDEKGKEIAWLDSLDVLCEEDRALVRAEVDAQSWMPRVMRIISVKDTVDYRSWQVETDSGERRFLSDRHEDPRLLPNGDVIVKDSGGDLYRIAPGALLDAKSRKVFKRIAG